MLGDIVTHVHNVFGPKVAAFILPVMLAVAAYKFFVTFRDDRFSDGIKALREAHESGILDEYTKKFIEARLSEAYFKRVTGVSIDWSLCQALMKLIQMNDGHLPFYYYKRVLPYLKYKNGEVEKVKIPRFQEIVGYVMLLHGIELLIIAIIMLVSFSKITLELISGNYLIFIFFICSYVIAGVLGIFFTFYPYFIHVAARDISKQLGQHEPVYIENCETIRKWKLPERLKRSVRFLCTLVIVFVAQVLYYFLMF